MQAESLRSKRDAIECSLSQVADSLYAIQLALARLVDHLAPEPSDIVGTPYLAKRLGCTTVWIADMVRNGTIPKGCIVPGTDNGKPWKFYRLKVESWLKTR